GTRCARVHLLRSAPAARWQTARRLAACTRSILARNERPRHLCCRRRAPSFHQTCRVRSWRRCNGCTVHPPVSDRFMTEPHLEEDRITKETMRRLPLFASLSESDLETLCQMTRAVSVPAGQILIEEG